MKTETPKGNDLISCSFHWLGQFRPVDSRCSNFSRTWLPTILIWYGTMDLEFVHNLSGIQCAIFRSISLQNDYEYFLLFFSRWNDGYCESTKSTHWQCVKHYKRKRKRWWWAQKRVSFHFEFDESKCSKFDKASPEYFMTRTISYYFVPLLDSIFNSFK